MDLNATYDFNIGDKVLTVTGNIYNLLDSEFINQSDAFGYFYGTGRTWRASVAYGF